VFGAAPEEEGHGRRSRATLDDDEVVTAEALDVDRVGVAEVVGVDVHHRAEAARADRAGDGRGVASLHVAEREDAGAGEVAGDAVVDLLRTEEDVDAGVCERRRVAAELRLLGVECGV